jgi:hypothetical protein
MALPEVVPVHGEGHHLIPTLIPHLLDRFSAEGLDVLRETSELWALLDGP